MDSGPSVAQFPEPQAGQQGQAPGDDQLDEPFHTAGLCVGRRESIGVVAAPWDCDERRHSRFDGQTANHHGSYVSASRTADMADAHLVFDDDCGFCAWWAEYVASHADVELVGFSELSPELEARLPEEYADCSHLVTDDRVYSCGESIEEGLLRSDLGSRVRPAFDRLRDTPYADLREWGYRHVAHNRRVWGRLVSKTPPAREADTESASR